ncbi:MAG TPA: tyrosine-type recombinase/integrase [Gemmatimonadales bacterium]|nr:tyrosine-type recombinase/integrase [Gemmatimonadales bacterium]
MRHPGHIQRRGDRLRVYLCVGGRRHIYTLATTDRKEAQQFAKTKQAELERQVERRRDGYPGPLRVSELFGEFERDELVTKSPGTQRSYRDSLKPIRYYFEREAHDPTVDRIRAGDVEGFMTWRRTHKVRTVKQPDGTETIEVTPARLHERTIVKDRAVLHAIFELADRREYRDGNPVARTKAAKYDARQPIILTDEQYAQLLEACDDATVRLYVLLLGETGCRDESEALWLRWDDVDLEGGFLQFVSGQNGHRVKSGKSRWTPLTPALTSALRDHAAAHRLACNTPWVFHHDRTVRHHHAGDRITSLRRSVTKAAQLAKLPAGWHPHDLRHRRVTGWLAEGANPVHVKEAVGHADLRMTMHYTHLVREHLKSLVNPGNILVTNRENGRNSTQSAAV